MGKARLKKLQWATTCYRWAIALLCRCGTGFKVMPYGRQCGGGHSQVSGRKGKFHLQSTTDGERYLCNYVLAQANASPIVLRVSRLQKASFRCAGAEYPNTPEFFRRDMERPAYCFPNHRFATHLELGRCSSITGRAVCFSDFLMRRSISGRKRLPARSAGTAGLMCAYLAGIRNFTRSQSDRPFAGTCFLSFS